MNARIGSLAGFVLSLAATVLAQPRSTPIAEKKIEITPFERSSVSPSGRTRVTSYETRQFVISPDGQLIAGEDAGLWQLELWSTQTGASLGKFGEINDPLSLAFSPDSKQLLTAERVDVNGFAVELWDLSRRERVRQLDEGANLYPFFGVAFSPNGRTLALAPGAPRSYSRARQQLSSIYLWDLVSGDEVGRLAAPLFTSTPILPGVAVPASARTASLALSCIAYSPDGRTIAGVVDRRIVLWEVASGEVRCEVGRLPAMSTAARLTAPAAQLASSLAFSPDGRRLACACFDGVRVWDVRSRTELLPLVGHEGSAPAICYSSDGTTLHSLGTDNRLLTWSTNEAIEPGAEQLAEDELAALGKDLQDGDTYRHAAARSQLAVAAKQAIPWLRANVKPLATEEVEKLKGHLIDIESDDFNLRKRATRALMEAGEAGLLALQQPRQRRVDRPVDVEGGVASDVTVIRSRLLTRLSKQITTDPQRRAVRVVELLERIGSDDAVALLGEYAKGMPGAVLTWESQAALERISVRRGAKLEGASLDALWIELAGAEPAKSYAAVEELIRRGDEVAPAIGEKLALLVSSDMLDAPKRIARLIVDLDSDDFATRETASQELIKFGALAAPAIREALGGEPSAEAKQRLIAILAVGGKSAVTGERLQALRALEVLESIGTPQAALALRSAESKVPEGGWIGADFAESLARLGNR